jgi:UrcA family protein
MRTIALSVLALIFSVAAATPSAADALEPVVVTSVVDTADLDLSSANGQRQLDLRIIQAAREVCGGVSDADLRGKNAARQCVASTIAAAASKREHLLAAARAGQPIRVASTR